MAYQGFGNNIDSSKYDSRLLSWGGFLNYADQKSEKDLRYIICINTKNETIHVVQHEQQQASFKFSDVMCVFENLKYDNALIIFWKNGKAPVTFFLDAQLERDSLQEMLQAIVKGNVGNGAVGAGVSPEEETTVEKKGKLKWAKRHMVVVKSRILVFREQNKSEFPLQMISLLEPEITIQTSDQSDKAFQINCQERAFHFQMSSQSEAQNFVDLLVRKRDKMQGEAKAFQKLKVLQQSESKRNMMQKSVMVRQQMQSQRLLSKRNLAIEQKDEALKVMLQNGSVMNFKADDADASNYTAMKQGDKNRKILKFDKAFKPHKHQSSIFIWGKARPPRLYPQHADQTSPFKHDQLTQKRFIYVSAAKDGTHVLGFTDNDWTFVWGESNFPGALGLGRETKSTLPFILKPLKKQKVIQVACSSRHGLAITMNSTVYGWGAKNLTNLPADTSQPTPLNFLANLGVTSIACSSTHSAAWHQNTTDVYSWGIPGSWLGIQDSNTKNFGRVEFDASVTKQNDMSVVKVECANQYSLFLLSDGRVATCGINEHGRMGIGQMSETDKVIFIESFTEAIGEISAGSFHSGYIDMKGKVYTCGVGTDYRLGHGNEETVYVPKIVDTLSEVELVRIECIEDRSFAITKYGCVLMWGCEPVTHMVHTAPFVYEYMRPFRIYQIVGTKDFTVALGVHAKQPVPRPDIEAEDNTYSVTKKTNALNNTIMNVINTGHTIGTDKGFQAKGVFGGMIQVEKQELIKGQPPPGPPPSQFGGSQMMMGSQMNMGGPPPGPPPNFVPMQMQGSMMNMNGPPQGPPPNGFGYMPPPNMGMQGPPNGFVPPPPNQNNGFNMNMNGPPQGPPPNFNPPPMQFQAAQQLQMPPPPNQQQQPPPMMNMNFNNNMNNNNNNNGPPPGPPPNFNNGNFAPFQYGPPPNQMGGPPPQRPNPPPPKFGQ